jgi:hypothetical protein
MSVLLCSQAIDLKCVNVLVTPPSFRRLKNERQSGGKNMDMWYNDENVDGVHCRIMMDIAAPHTTKRHKSSSVDGPWRRMVAIYCGYTRAIVLDLDESLYRRYVVLSGSASNAPNRRRR